MYKSIIIFFIFSSFIACNSSSTSTQYKDPHKELHDAMHDNYIHEKHLEEQKARMEKVQGSYQGKIPCADCEHIDYKLTLSSTGSYVLSRTYEGKSDKPVLVQGDYSIDENQLITLDKAQGMNFLKVKNNGLELLDKNGKEIPGDLNHQYILDPITEAMLQKDEVSDFQRILREKQQEGIDFYAVGNEPFWKLDMDFDKTFKFTTMSGVNFNVPAIKPVEEQNGKVQRYHLKTESSEIIIQLTHVPCTDTMAGNKFPYQVTVQYKSGTESQLTTVKGCGQFIPDYRIHNIWAIQTVNGADITSKTFTNKQPVFEFNLSTNTLLGNNGCNSFSGPVEVQHQKIYFGMYVTTMMACVKHQELSSQIMKIIGHESLEYQIEHGLLTLIKDGKTIMTLKSVD